jgi:glycosyltransferase involved in cell wall biosynthesis
MPSAQTTGGSEEALRQLLVGRSEQRLSYDIIFLEDGPLIAWARREQIPSKLINAGRLRQPLRWRRSVQDIRKHIEAIGSDFVLGWILKAHLYGGIAAWLAGIPCGWFQLGSPQPGIIDFLASKVPSQVTFACSDYVAQLQRAAVPKTVVKSIPLGVDAKRFGSVADLSRDQCRKAIGLPDGVPIVGTVGRLQHWKGMHLMIDAMPNVLKKLPECRCVIVGGPFASEPGYGGELRDQVKRLNLGGHVIFAGERQDIPNWVRAFDVFVHASQSEPFGIVVIEALAAGTPVISFAPSGVASILRELPSCIVLESRDAKPLAGAIETTLRSNFTDQAQLVSMASRYSDREFKNRMELAIRGVIEEAG